MCLGDWLIGKPRGSIESEWEQRWVGVLETTWLWELIPFKNWWELAMLLSFATVWWSLSLWDSCVAITPRGFGLGRALRGPLTSRYPWGLTLEIEAPSLTDPKRTDLPLAVGFPFLNLWG